MTKKAARPRHQIKKRRRDDSWAPNQAFAVARRVAGCIDPGVTAPVYFPNNGTGDFGTCTDIVRKVLRKAYRAYGASIPARETTCRDVIEYVNLAAEGEAEQAIASMLSEREEAGYLLGLALGLRLAGGAR